MKIFKFRRFVSLFKLDLAQNKKSYITFSLVLFILYFLMELMVFSAIGQKYYQGLDVVFTRDVLTLFVPISVFIMILGASWTFSVLKTKEKRISYLMIPASNFEKFLCRLLICTLGVLVVNLLVFFLTDLIRTLIFMVMNKPVGSIIPVMMDGNYTPFMTEQLLYDQVEGQIELIDWLDSAAMYTSFASLFILGSSVFRKHAFVYTSLSLLALGILFNTLWMRDAQTTLIITRFWSGSLFTLVMLGLSYWQFKRIVVMRRSWF